MRNPGPRSSSANFEEPVSNAGPPAPEPVPPAVEAFISRWKKSGAAERANYQSFLAELCTLLDVPQHDPNLPDDEDNAYVFERRVRMSRADGETTYGFIDFYRRGAFVLETKQGVERKDQVALSDAGREREANTRKGHGIRGTTGWDTALLKARNQAERYIRHLPASEGRPPFLIVADVGHCIDLYSEFTRRNDQGQPFN